MPRPVSNPPNPWQACRLEWLGEPPLARLEVFEEQARSIISHNDSPDVPINHSVNCYRGCYHGCVYCYARPSHQYLGFGAGSDFERKIVVKINAPQLLHQELMRPSWKGDAIAFSGNTDCYQPLEASYGLTRACLEVCLQFRNPVTLITKSALIRRDIELLAELSRKAAVHVAVSIPFADDETARIFEPYASTTTKRLETLRMLSAAGITTGIGIAPIIPGLSEPHIGPLLESAKEAGARDAFIILLRLPAEALQVFAERIEAGLPPERVRRIRNAIKEMRQGRDYDPRFGLRMIGHGPRWDALDQLFHLHCARLGLNTDRDPPRTSTFVRPGTQGELFPTDGE